MLKSSPVSFRPLAEHSDVLLRQQVRRVPQVQFEQVRPRVLLWQVYVDSLFKPEGFLFKYSFSSSFFAFF